MKRQHIFGIIGLLVVVLIVLVLVIPEKNKETKTPEVENTLTLGDPQTFVGEGDLVYNFEGIDWNLDLIEAGSARVPETKVGFYFDTFTRYQDGVPAVFGSPFHIGFFKGDCAPLDTLPQNALLDDVEGSFIAGLVCIWEEEASLILLAQNENIVSVYDIMGNNPEILNHVRDIDITTIVQ
ncbi:hypothetical protein H6776_02350 [Candidatus Nomurabacteria bacterium]|nr:hypothetical protein [Candidatus Nomurabacteria bacterium]